MQHTITIKDQEVTMIFGYRTLKQVTEKSKNSGGELTMEMIEDVLFDAIQFGLKSLSKKVEIKKADLIDWLENNYDAAVEAQAALEVFMRTHGEKRKESLIKLGLSPEQANLIPG